MTSGLRILILSVVPTLTAGTRAQPLAVIQLLIFENTPLSALTGPPGQVKAWSWLAEGQYPHCPQCLSSWTVGIGGMEGPGTAERQDASILSCRAHVSHTSQQKGVRKVRWRDHRTT